MKSQYGFSHKNGSDELDSGETVGGNIAAEPNMAITRSPHLELRLVAQNRFGIGRIVFASSDCCGLRGAVGNDLALLGQVAWLVSQSGICNTRLDRVVDVDAWRDEAAAAEV